MESRLESLEKTVEQLRKASAEQDVRFQGVSSDITDIKRQLEGIDEVKDLIKVWMKKQGITIDPSTPGSSSVRGKGEEAKEDPITIEEEEVKSKDSKSTESEESETKSLKHTVKVKLPNFDGTDTSGWISRAEKYFEVQKTKVEMKVPLAYICMEGPPVHWFRFLRKKVPQLTWEMLTSEMIRRYCGRKAGNPYELLAEMKQGGSVGEYIEQFEILAAQVEDMTEVQALGYFMSGLKEEVKRRVRTHNPQDIIRAIELAQDVEEELEGIATKSGESAGGATLLYAGSNVVGGASRGSIGGGVVTRSNVVSSPKVGLTSILTSLSNNPQTHRNYTQDNFKNSANSGSRASLASTANTQSQFLKAKGTRHFPYQEYLKRREEGRCFQCGQPYGPLYRCPKKNLRVIILEEDEGTDQNGDIRASISMEAAENEEGTPEEMTCQRMELPLYSVGGITQPRTMKLKGRVGPAMVIVMVDSGASHNFVSKELVEGLKLPVTQTSSFDVCLGNEQRKISQGCCKGMEVIIGALKIRERFYLFNLGGVDIIMGVECLEKLGKVKVDWRALTMEFNYGGETIHLQGDPSLHRVPVSSKSILKIAEVDFSGVLFLMDCSKGMEVGKGENELSRRQGAQLQNLLEKYHQGFTSKPGLPPERETDHSIPLKPEPTL